MKKIVLFLFSLCLFLIAAAGALYLFRVPVISYALSQTLNTHCSMKACTFSKNALQIKELTIQNPPGCTLKNALFVRQIDVTLNWKELFKTLIGTGSRKIVLDSVQIEHSLMGVELFTLAGTDTNWSRLLNTVEPPEATTQANSSSSLDFQISSLVLTDIQFNVQYHALSKIPITPSPIPRIELKNIGTDTDVTMKQLFFIIFKVFIEQAANGLNLKTLIPEMIIERVLPVTAPFFEINDAKNFLEKFFQGSPPNNTPNDQH